MNKEKSHLKYLTCIEKNGSLKLLVCAFFITRNTKEIHLIVAMLKNKMLVQVKYVFHLMRTRVQ